MWAKRKIFHRVWIGLEYVSPELFESLCLRPQIWKPSNTHINRKQNGSHLWVVLLAPVLLENHSAIRIPDCCLCQTASFCGGTEKCSGSLEHSCIDKINCLIYLEEEFVHPRSLIFPFKDFISNRWLKRRSQARPSEKRASFIGLM